MVPIVATLKGPYAALSNFAPYPVFVFGTNWPTSEHAYQAMKTESFTTQSLIQQARTPGEAKRLGRGVKLRDGWDGMKREVMYEIVAAKVKQNPEVAAVLKSTSPMEIEEGNTWGDTYWGVDLETRVGENHLGKILMHIRDHS
jgi:ribA/ribD-fused uncharacterized protein